MPSIIIADHLRSVFQSKNCTQAFCSEQTGVSESTIGCSVADLTGEEPTARPETDLSIALDAQEAAYERLLKSERYSHQHALHLLTENCDYRINREKHSTTLWLVLAIIFMLSFTAVSASYYRFHWDITNPTKGSIQYERLDELKEALGIETE